tara:strand:+ start:55 stop:555 length:501 start_codon:yes stop_codon:yes gene_type:complete
VEIFLSYKIIKNYLEKEYFETLKKTIFNNNFPFYFSDYVSYPSDTRKITDFFFYHIIYKNFTPKSNYFPMFEPLLTKLNIKSLIRIKINMYTRTEKIIKHSMHTDTKYEHKGAILSLNKCNGGTWIEDKFIESEENQMVLFDPSKPHSSTSCTNDQVRVNIILNYF